MKIERLIGIITVLQQKGKVTAPYLAEKFEVSKRTISRDVEALCIAGIPIVTEQGAGGGISIAEGFSVDTTVFTENELSLIFAGLKSIDSVSRTSKAALLKEKIGGVIPVSENMLIDLSSFHKDSLSEKIELLQNAIDSRRRVTFRYFYEKGEEDKLIEPALVVFKWSSWYVLGFCPERDGFRMYKLTRLWDLSVTGETFEPRVIPQDTLRFEGAAENKIMITALYEASEKFRLVDEYGSYCFTVSEDGRLLAEFGFRSEESAFQWFLGFGSKVEIVAPEEFRQTFLDELKRTLKIYENT
ncbi:MAG: YafY family transcriptional regulator [Prevotella sp.]|nr:YafY family transcriptional regulator [Prevotella sp.]